MPDIDSINLNSFLENKLINIFVISFLINLIFIFQGIDLLDTGVHLTHQISATSIPIEIEYTLPIIFLTDFIGGLWLRLINGPSLLWARTGGVFIISINTMIIFSILSNYFERKKTFLTTIISVLFITTIPALNIIDYYTFPALLINVSAWIFNKILIENIGSTKSNICSAILGFMFISIILSKFTLMLLLFIPICLLIFNHFSKNGIMDLNKLSAPILFGAIASTIIFSLFYYHLGILNSYVEFIFYSIYAYLNNQGTSSSHALRDLFNSYAIHYFYAITGSIILALMLLAKSFIKQKYMNRVANVTTFFFIIFCIFLTWDLTINRIFRPEFLVIVLFDAAIGIIILSSIKSLFICKNPHIRFLLIIGLIVMLITPLGSNTGIIKSVQGMWLILPLSILCIDQIKRYGKNNVLKSILPSITSILVTILVVSLLIHIMWVYGDDLNRLHLNTTFLSPQLHGIYSTPEKVELIDDLLLHIDKYSNKGDYAIISSNMPIFYYLTETKPAINPWIEGKKLYDLNMNKKINPKLIIMSKIDTSKRNWPDEHNFKNLSEFRNRYDPSNYSIIWENRAFVIYELN